MRKDPIIEEVRKVGENLAREAGFDAHSFFTLLREREQKHAARIVTRSPVKYADRYSNGTISVCAEDGTDYMGRCMMD